jgi:DNA-binding NtrC family response regulator
LIPQNKSTPILLLISEPQMRNDLCILLVENNYYPLLLPNQEELLRVLKDNQFASVLIDCAAVSCYGARTISKIKVACRHGRIIVFCDKAHLCDCHHRDLIKEILAIGVYACIVAPYKEWEVLSLVAYDPQRENK